MIANGYGMTLGDDENILNLDGDNAQLSKYTKTTDTLLNGVLKPIHFKLVTLCQLDLNTNVF